MSAMIFMNNKSRQNGKSMISGHIGFPPKKKPQPNYRRPTPVVTTQPSSSASIGMGSGGTEAHQMYAKPPPPPPTSYFCLSVMCFFCCPVFAAFALFFASQVNPNYSRGNYIGAKWASRFAVFFCIVALLTAVGIAIYFLYIFGISSSNEVRDELKDWWNNQFPSGTTETEPGGIMQ